LLSPTALLSCKIALNVKDDAVAYQIPQFVEVRLNLFVVTGKVTTWRGIHSGVESALGDRMTSNSGVRDVFRKGVTM